MKHKTYLPHFGNMAGTPSCSIKEGFEEAISAHMGGLAYKLGRRIEWDAVEQKIIAQPGEDLDAVLLSNTSAFDKK